MKKHLKKIIFFTILLLVIGFTALLFTMDHFIKNEAQEQLTKLFEKPVTIGKIETSLLGPKVAIYNFDINKEIQLDFFSVKVSLWKILSKKITINNLELKGTQLTILKENKKYQVLGTAKLLQKLSEPKNGEPKKDEPGYGVYLDQATIKDFKISYKDSPEEDAQEITIKELVLSNWSSKAVNQAGKIDLSFKIKDSKIKLKGSIDNYLSEGLKAQMHFSIEDFDLKTINLLGIKEIPEVYGDFSIEGDLDYSPEKILAKISASSNEIAVHSLVNNNLVDYFIKNLKITDLKFSQKDVERSVNAEMIQISNLITPITKEALKNKKVFSKFGTITISNFNYIENTSQDNPSMNITADYNNGGIIKISKSSKDKNTKEELNITISSVDLVPFGETFEQNLGYQVDGGKLNLSMNTKTDKGQTKGKIKVRLEQLSLGDQTETGKKLKGQTDIPLATAISVAKNKKGVISAELDISGSQSDPNFGFYPMLRKGFGTIMISQLTEILVSKLSDKFLPFLLSSIPFSPGNAIMIAKEGVAYIRKPRFQNLEFKPNSSDLIDDSKDALKKLADFLKKNKGFNFNICPIAAKVEKKIKIGSKGDVLDLALKRIKTITEIMNEEKVSTKSYSFCRPQYLNDSIDIGTVEVSI